MYRLIYKSRAVQDIDWNVVENILHQSEANNALTGITGFLAATRTHFLPVIEGSAESGISL